MLFELQSILVRCRVIFVHPIGALVLGSASVRNALSLNGNNLVTD